MVQQVLTGGISNNYHQEMDSKGNVILVDDYGNVMQEKSPFLKRLTNGIKATATNFDEWLNRSDYDDKVQKQKTNIALGLVTAPFGMGANATKALGAKLAPKLGSKIGMLTAQNFGGGLVGGSAYGFGRGLNEGENPFKTALQDGLTTAAFSTLGGYGLGKLGQGLTRRKLLKNWNDDLGTQYFNDYIADLNNKTNAMADFRGVRLGIGRGKSGILYDKNPEFINELGDVLNPPPNTENPDLLHAIIGDVSKDDITYKLGLENGYDLEGTPHIFNYDGNKHIEKYHKKIEKSKLKQNMKDLPITQQDIENLPDIVFNADNVKFLPATPNNQKNRFVYIKNVPEGEIGYVEYLQNKQNKLASKTMYKKRRGTSAAANNDPFRVTSETPTSNNIITDYDKNLKSFMKDSKVVDENGNPLVAYHATNKDFDVFDNTLGEFSGYTFFSKNKDTTRAKYSKYNMPVYLDIKKPYHTDYFGYSDLYGKPNFRQDLINQGYDGIIADKEGTYIVFNPTQIKSVNNQGTFDPTNPNIYKSILGGLGLYQALKQQSRFQQELQK